MEAIRVYLEKTRLARKQAYENRTIFPLLASDGPPPDYLTLECFQCADTVGLQKGKHQGLVPGRTQPLFATQGPQNLMNAAGRLRPDFRTTGCFTLSEKAR